MPLSCQKAPIEATVKTTLLRNSDLEMTGQGTKDLVLFELGFNRISSGD